MSDEEHPILQVTVEQIKNALRSREARANELNECLRQTFVLDGKSMNLRLGGGNTL